MEPPFSRHPLGERTSPAGGEGEAQRDLAAGFRLSARP
jgi:hypothetical protein